LRQRRVERNKRNAGRGLRAGWDAFTSPAEEAAMRLAQREADEKIVAAALAQEQAEDEKLAQARAELPARLADITERYKVAQARVALAFNGGSVEVKPNAKRVEFVGLWDALHECARLRRE